QGFAVKTLGGEALALELAAKPAGERLLVLPNSACFPVVARKALLDYLKAGGNLLAIGGPVLSHQVIKLNGQWLTQEMLLDKLVTTPPHATLLDLGRLDLSTVRRNTGTPQSKPELHIIGSGISETPAALEVRAAAVT